MEVDITALDAVDEVRRELSRRGIVFALTRVKQDLPDDLTAYGLADTVGSERIFPTLPTPVAAYRKWRRDQWTARRSTSPGVRTAERLAITPPPALTRNGCGRQSRQSVVPVPYGPATVRVAGPMCPDPWGRSAPLRPAP